MTATTSRETRPDRRRYQLRTAAASRYQEPWTRDQETYLLSGPGTVAERAQVLGRTYYAAERRLGKLRRQMRARIQELAA